MSNAAATKKQILNAVKRDTKIKSSMSMEEKIKELQHEIDQLKYQSKRDKFIEHRTKLGELLKDFKYIVNGGSIEHIDITKQLLHEHTSVSFDEGTGLLQFNLDYGTGGVSATLIKEIGDSFHKAHLLHQTINNIAHDVSKANIKSDNLDDIINTVGEVGWRYEEMFKELKDGN